ncbi:MAG: phospholipid carrier-dependent glycosyltransferase [Campylobacterales bacterium]|nr:phospholipid carrier-dependent glycosyltransferase [Campylobacterales bacterium]
MIRKLWSEQRELLSYMLAVLIIAMSTYFVNYYNPSAVFWDENYHIASAQKYIGGVMYMEPHPPLGKLFIALGEVLVNPNEGKDLAYFLSTDYIKTFPQGYSFAGVRLFPTLFGALGGVLFFLILYRLGRHSEYAFFFSSLYLFANAFILQSRSAMLESTQMFFIFAAILYFLILFDKEQRKLCEHFILGLLIGLAVMVKVNGLILILLYPFLHFYRQTPLSLALHVKQFVLNGLALVAGLGAVAVFIFYLHFALGSTLGSNHYKASQEYQTILSEGKTASPANFGVMLRDNLVYMSDYSKGVPRYDACKKGENGSLAATWPFGNKSINYRWAKENGKVSYLYLQANPMIWFAVVLAMITAFALLLGRFIFGLHVSNQRLFYLIGIFSAMYASYMITMFNIERVMYLYHYFIALFFGTFVLYLLFHYIFEEAIRRDSKVLYWAVLIFVAEILYCFYLFAPFTYYQPLDTMEFYRRVWFSFWKLEPVL